MSSSSSSSGQSKRPTNSEITESADCASGSSKSTRATRGKRLKKDDSGINDIQESEGSEESPDSSETRNSSPEKDESDHDSVLNESDRLGNDPALENLDLGPSTSGGAGNVAAAAMEKLYKNEKSDSNGESLTDVEVKLSNEQAEAEKLTSERKQKRLARKLRRRAENSDRLNSIRPFAPRNFDESTDDSSDDEETVREKEKKAKAKLAKFDPTPNVPRPKHCWNATKSILARQYGSSSNYSPHLFRNDAYGSLHMVERLELMYKMKKHDGCVNALHFNETGTKLATGSDDLDIVIWDWTISEPLLEYNSGHRSNVFQAKFIPLCGDTCIVSCARDGQVRLGEISPEGSRNTRKLAQHKGAVHKLAIQTDSPNTFLTCGEDAAVFKVDLRVEKPEKLVVCRGGGLKKVPLYSIHINPHKSEEFVVGGRDQFVKVYDSRFVKTSESFVKTYCPKHLITSDKTNVTAVVYNYNGTEILASYNDDDLYIFNSQKNSYADYMHRYKGHRNSQTVKGVNYFGPKSEYVVSGSDCGYIFFWEKETEHIVKFMYGDEGGVVNVLEPNPILPVLATSGLDDDIKIWVPSCEDPPDLEGLRNLLIQNMKDREEERTNGCPDAFLDQTIGFLMQHLSRSHSRWRAGAAGPMEREVEPDSESNSSSDSDADQGLEGFSRSIQCSQS